MSFKLERDIEVLGNTDQEVAKYLETNGIKGDCGNAYECPIANYLRAKGWAQVEVAGDTISAVDSNEVEHSVEAPWSVTSFIDGFDSGKEYQYLKR